MEDTRNDPHALPEQDFLDEVHSFEFWFQAVEGYLSGRPYGRLPDTPAEILTDRDREVLISTLCNYCVGTCDPTKLQQQLWGTIHSKS
jgi:hypothetical protein